MDPNSLSNAPAGGLCLNMIVKDEAANIERCIASMAPVISSWVICDTGSTDDTPERVERFFAERGIPGELHRFAFENFGQARNEALDRCRRSSLTFDYVLLADADMELVVEDPHFASRLSATAYAVQQRNAISYDNVRLLRRDSQARYVGVTHEYLDVAHTELLTEIWFVDHASGANRVGKFERDAAWLEAELVDDPDNARSVFYLAQSYRDAGSLDKARDAYVRRSTMAGWDEERWYSLYEIGRLSERLGAPAAEIQAAYLAAYQFRPTRGEPLYQLARFHRERSEFALAHLFAKQAVAIPRPAHSLFVEDSVYLWRSLDELSVAASWVGAFEEGWQAIGRLIRADTLPAHERQRVDANLRFYQDHAAKRQPTRA